MAFSNELFPVTVSYGSSGGPRHASSISELQSGFRKVATRWDGALRRWDAKYGIRYQSQLYEVYEFVLAHNGAEHTFKYQDPLDYTSNADDGSDTAIARTDQVLGNGDGTTQTFQLRKLYQRGSLQKSRAITLPFTDPAPLVEVAGSLQTEGVDYTLNYLTGEILFATAPGVGELVRAGFQFYCHAQFSQEVDQFLNVAVTGFKAGEIPSIIIDEVPNDASNSVGRSWGGSNHFDLSVDTKISLNTGEIITVDPSTGNPALWLPNPTRLGSGMNYYLMINLSGSNAFGIRDHTGVAIKTVAATEHVYVSLIHDQVAGTKTWMFT